MCRVELATVDVEIGDGHSASCAHRCCIHQGPSDVCGRSHRAGWERDRVRNICQSSVNPKHEWNTVPHVQVTHVGRQSNQVPPTCEREIRSGAWHKAKPPAIRKGFYYKPRRCARHSIPTGCVFHCEITKVEKVLHLEVGRIVIVPERQRPRCTGRENESAQTDIFHGRAGGILE